MSEDKKKETEVSNIAGHRRKILWIGFAMTFIVCLAWVMDFFTNAELKSVDWRFKVRGPRETAAPVRVVVEERYPEYAFEYRQVQRRKRGLTWGGAGAFMPAYTLSIAFGSAQVGSFYDQARSQDADFSTAAAFLPVIPILGPILTQSWMDSQAANLNNPSYDAGAHLVGAVWGTLIQTLGATAMIIGISTKLPAPFTVEGDSADATVAMRADRKKVQVGVSAGPGSAGLTMRW